MPNVFFTSDTHFGHSRMLDHQAGTRVKADGSPFEGIQEHDEYLIEQWNALVGPKDLIFHIGDFAFVRDRNDTEGLLRRLNGQKCLIQGNHDHKSIRKAKGWSWVKQMYELKVPHPETGERQMIVLCHFPFITWNVAHHGSWSLHGHCHGNLSQHPCSACGHKSERWPGLRLDVGTDCWGLKPIELSEVTQAMKQLIFEPVDHHVES